MSSHEHFVEDGDERYRAAIEPAIRAAVVAEYAERLAKASMFQKIRLQRVISREVERRVAALIGSGLY